ncbi:MAG: RidA family protein [bacterium]|nr:RidA family protein [Acidimicrobiia bacterium]MCY4651292.1 RidA family protein [bacterium]
MSIETINPEGMSEPPEPYSHAVRAGDTVYLAGQVAFDAAGEVVGETTGEQAEQIWKNIAEILEACGGSVANVVKITYFCQDIRELPEEMVVRRRVFGGGPYPAVTACQAAALGLPGLKLEVDVIAVIPQ